MAQTPKERKAAERARYVAQGLQRWEIWALPKQIAKLKKIAETFKKEQK